MSANSELDVKCSIELIVDIMYKKLNAYEVSLYLYIFRKSVASGITELRIGKKTIQSEFVHGARGGGRENVGGIWVNYAHITRILNGLKAKGCIEIGDTTREGTLYTVRMPSQIHFVLEALSSAELKSEPEDYFHNQDKRLEIFERDGWRCQYCGDIVDNTTSTIDHYIPQYIGGGHNKENLRTSCLKCNSIKSGRSFEEAAPQLLKAAAERRKGLPSSK